MKQVTKMENIPKTRKEAQALGAKYYFTGTPCKHGHIALRKTKGACVECLKAEHIAVYDRRKEYFAEYNRSEKGQANKRKYYEANKETVIAKAIAAPAELKRQRRKKYDKENPEQRKARCSVRRRRFRLATPLWLTPEQKQEIKNLYLKAIELGKSTGQKFEVDHIEPILGENVCGLHVPWNMQILLKEENLKKSNKRVQHD